MRKRGGGLGDSDGDGDSERQGPRVYDARMLRRRNESELHYRLKRAAWKWLWARGCRAIAFEAKPDPALPARVDVLAVAPDKATYIIEAKQSRGDFLRDLARQASAGHARALAHLEELWTRYERAAEGARALAAERGGSSHLAVPEFAPFAEAHLQLALKARRRLERTDAAAPGKFGLDQLGRIARYRFLAAPPQVAAPEELPPGWGLLAYDEKKDELRIARPANPSGKGEPARVLAEVARVNTQDLMMSSGVTWHRGQPRFPKPPPAETFELPPDDQPTALDTDAG